MEQAKNDNRGILYLVPNTLGKTGHNKTIPDYVIGIIRRLRFLIVENIQTTRSYLQWIGDTVPEYEIRFFVLNKNTRPAEITGFLDPALEGHDIGLISEAGCPAVADPGSLLVREAHRKHIRVIPLTGPNSMLMALMSSGFNGQSFAFRGYLPVDEDNRRDALRELENDSRKLDQTQLFMEAPHRNREMLETVINTCSPASYLCTATDLTLDSEMILSLSIQEWRKKNLPDLQKRPTVFVLYAGGFAGKIKSSAHKQRKSGKK